MPQGHRGKCHCLTLCLLYFRWQTLFVWTALCCKHSLAPSLGILDVSLQQPKDENGFICTSGAVSRLVLAGQLCIAGKAEVYPRSDEPSKGPLILAGITTG